MVQKRTYRNQVSHDTMHSFNIAVKETDLCIHALQRMDDLAKDLVLQYRAFVEAYIKIHPEFGTTLVPWRMQGPAPKIIADMAKAGERSGVGPMAAIAGAISEYVGRDLLAHTDEVIVENGGDVFIKCNEPVSVGVYAGKSPLSLRIGLRVDSSHKPLAVCTSSGTVGHSLSLGRTDAVSIVSESCALADAAATAIGNQVHTKADIQAAIEYGQNIEGVQGILIILDDELGMWGDLDIIPLQGKKG